MSERPLEVGETGILQNLHWKGAAHLNGLPVEILEVVNYQTYCAGCGKDETVSYVATTLLGGEGQLHLDEIRRITDPDATQSIEHDEAVTV